MLKRLLFVIAAPLLLTGCLLQPGKFVSELTLLRDGTFAFSYRGEIQAVGMSSLMKTAAAASEADFIPECFDDEGEARDCSPQEAAEQEEADKRENEQMLQMFSALTPGMDASDPETIERFLAQLRRMKGWNAVEHVGNGIFEVDVAIDGQADRNFVFPVVEDTPMLTPFVVMTVRREGKVRVQASGFRTDPNSGNMGAMGALAALGDESREKGEELPRMVTLDGTFTVRTDGEILTNNTEEGPATEGGRRVLTWRILPATTEAPETLIQL